MTFWYVISKKRKKSCFYEIWKKRKIDLRILEHWRRSNNTGMMQVAYYSRSAVDERPKAINWRLRAIPRSSKQHVEFVNCHLFSTLTDFKSLPTILAQYSRGHCVVSCHTRHRRRVLRCRMRTSRPTSASSVTRPHTTRVHGPFRAVLAESTARQCYFVNVACVDGPWTQPVNTDDVYRPSVDKINLKAA